MKCGGFKFYACSYFVLLHEWCACVVFLSTFILLKKHMAVEPLFNYCKGKELG